MTFTSLCNNYFPYVNYLNERILLYSITYIAFAGVFILYWILKSYTFFIKAKVPSFKKPLFPYGHFTDVIQQNTQLSEHLNKYFRRYKKDNCKIGGLFLFIHPIILIVDSKIINKLSLEGSKDKYKRITDIFDINHVNKLFVDETLIKNRSCLELKQLIQKIVLTSFGISDTDVETDIEHLVARNHRSSRRYYISLLWKIFQNNSCKKQILLRKFIGSNIENRKKNDIQRNDFIDGLVQFVNSEGRTSKGKFVQIISDLILNNLEYTYNAIYCCLFELVKNPHIQEELFSEIRRSDLGGLEASNINKLVYLDAIVKETFRKYPPVSTVILKNIPEEVLSYGKLIKDCKLCIVPIYSFQRDPTVYLQPLVFDPDRFLENCNAESFFKPFGIDELNEINMDITTLLVKMTLIHILKRGHVATDQTLPLNLQFDPRYSSLHPKSTIEFKLK